MANRRGNAVLRAYLPNSQVHILTQIDPYEFIDRAPLLYHAFQYGHRSKHQADIDAPSESAVTVLIDYARTGHYPQEHLDPDEPVLFLHHIQTYILAENFDVQELMTHAHGALNISACRAISLGAPPIDLIDAIRFVYEHISSQELHNMVSILANYCFEAFTTQSLSHNQDFIEVVRDLPLFSQDLCKICSDRNFDEAWAQAIINLAHDAPPVRSEPEPTTLASRDLPDEMYMDEEEEESLVKLEELEETMDMDVGAGISLADSTATIREAVKAEDNDSDMEEETAVAYASESEDGFFMVRPTTPKPTTSSLKALPHRPKPHKPIPNEPMSSPEMIAMSDSDHFSDDEDSML